MLNQHQMRLYNQGHQRYQSYNQYQNKQTDNKEAPAASDAPLNLSHAKDGDRSHQTKPSTSDSLMMKNGSNQIPNSPIKQFYESVDHASNQAQGMGEPYSPQYPNRKARSIN